MPTIIPSAVAGSEAERIRQSIAESQDELNRSRPYQELVSVLGNQTFNDIRSPNEIIRIGPIVIPEGEYLTANPQQRFIRDPLNSNQYIDMRHFFASASVVSETGLTIGDDLGYLKEIEQWITYEPSAFKPSDFRSNTLGDIFGRRLNRTAPLGPQLDSFFQDYLNRRLPSEAYRSGEDLARSPIVPLFIRDLIDAFRRAEQILSPLVLDLDGDGIELTSLANQLVRFDLDMDGLREATGWVKSDDGLLVFDRNNDTIINDFSELFGAQSMPNSGFDRLRELDSNGDNWISTADVNFSKLQVWRDLDQDGFSDRGELFSLAQLGISRIQTSFTRSSQTVAGNTITDFSNYELANGTQRQIVDVWFAVNAVNTRYDFSSVFNQQAVITKEILRLPDLVGYGRLPNLAISMAKDNQLLGLVSAFAQQMQQRNFTGIESAIETILFQWAGINVSPFNRGFFDGRRLTVMEKLLNDSFDQVGVGLGNVGDAASSTISEAYNKLFKALSSRLIAQTLKGSVTYDLVSDRLRYSSPTGQTAISNTLEQQTVEQFFVEENGTGTENYVVNFAGRVNNTIGTGSGNDTINTGLGRDTVRGGAGNDLLVLDYSSITYNGNSPASGLTTTISGGVQGFEGFYRAYNSSSDFDEVRFFGIERFQITGTTTRDQIITRSGDDVLNGGAGDDSLFAGFGNDTLDGGDGNDTLVGDSGNDLLISGSGSDYLEGGDGNDQLIAQFSEGVDTFVGGLGDDYYGINFANLAVVVEQAGQGIDTIGTLLSMSLMDIKDSAGNVADVENLRAAVPVTTALTLTGNHLNNIITGSNGNDTIDGGDGNDVLVGGIGNDLLITGRGSDYLEGGDGNDQLVAQFSEGVDTFVGGLGDDYYGINFANLAVVVEQAGQGIDTIGTLLSLSLLDIKDSAGNIAHIENLRAATAVTTALTLAGNSLNNAITGSNGNDTIDGGDGNDVLVGGAGNDLLITGRGSDYMEGGEGNDQLIAQFSEGVDTFIGGLGDDYYGINFANLAVVVEQAGQGIDTIGTLLSMSLMDIKDSAGNVADIENLTAATAVTTALTLTGNHLNNAIAGSNGNDILSGSSGNDILVGGGGADQYWGGVGTDSFQLDRSSVDTINDFETTDHLRLSVSQFSNGGLIAGQAIRTDQLLVGSGSTATAASHRLVYNNTNGSLFYDADGTGSIGAIQIGVLSNRPMSLSASQFMIVA